MSRMRSPAALASLCALCLTACTGSGGGSESESVGATPTSNGSTNDATSGTVEDDPLVGVDPELVDPQGDFHLSAGSPAIGTGLADPSVILDFDGACYDDPPSRGAFEFKG